MIAAMVSVREGVRGYRAANVRKERRWAPTAIHERARARERRMEAWVRCGEMKGFRCGQGRPIEEER
jgi:hypothetical protein